MPESTSTQTQAASGRAPYTTPQLVVIGAVHNVTEAVGSMSMMDGGWGSMRRSQ